MVPGTLAVQHVFLTAERATLEYGPEGFRFGRTYTQRRASVGRASLIISSASSAAAMNALRAACAFEWPESLFSSAKSNTHLRWATGKAVSRG